MTHKLDKIDRKLLFELNWDARLPDTQLAKLIGRSKESVRYRIKQLENKGILKGFTTWIDPSKLGYSSAKMYLTLANKPELTKEFIEYVKSDKRLFWLGIAEGAWNAGLTFFVKNNQEFFDLKNTLFTKFKDLILDTHTATLVEVTVGSLNFLHNRFQETFSMFSKPENRELDIIEKSILKTLYKNSRASLVSISKNAKTTIDIVRNRIKKLEKEEIIVGYTTNIDFNKLGYEFFKTFLYFSNLSNPDERKLMQYVKQHSKILHVVKQISPWDIELEIMCENYLEYNKILADIKRTFSNIIRKVETSIVSENYVFPSKELIFE